jgi:hypothetical protein
MTTYKWWLHVSFFKHSTSSTSTNVPPDQPFPKSQHCLSNMGPPKCNFLLQINFKRFLAHKNSCLLYTRISWFHYVIISNLPFDFKFVCSIHKKCKHLQSLLYLIIILGAHLWSLSHSFSFVTSLLYVFYYPLYFLLHLMFSKNTMFSPLFFHTLRITLLHKSFWSYSIELQFDELIGCKDLIHFS